MLLHGHQRPVGQHKVRLVSEFLDEAEDEIPSAAIQSGRMLAQFIEDLVHLEGRENRLYQHSGANRAARNAEFILREVEHIVPQLRLKMILKLWQVEIGTASPLDQSLRIVEEVNPE